MGLAPVLVERSFEIIQQVHESGVAMLIVEQNANVSLSIADRGYVLSTGRIVLEGKASELIAERRSPQGLPRALAESRKDAFAEEADRLARIGAERPAQAHVSHAQLAESCDAVGTTCSGVSGSASANIGDVTARGGLGEPAALDERTERSEVGSGEPDRRERALLEVRARTSRSSVAAAPPSLDRPAESESQAHATISSSAGSRPAASAPASNVRE